MRAEDRHLQGYGRRMGLQKHTWVVSVREKTLHGTELRGPKRSQRFLPERREMSSRLRSRSQQQVHRYSPTQYKARAAAGAKSSVLNPSGLWIFFADINECSSPTRCLKNEVCYNTNGSYYCLPKSKQFPR